MEARTGGRCLPSSRRWRLWPESRSRRPDEQSRSRRMARAGGPDGGTHPSDCLASAATPERLRVSCLICQTARIVIARGTAIVFRRRMSSPKRRSKNPRGDCSTERGVQAGVRASPRTPCSRSKTAGWSIHGFLSPRRRTGETSDVIAATKSRRPLIAPLLLQRGGGPRLFAPRQRPGAPAFCSGQRRRDALPSPSRHGSLPGHLLNVHSSSI